MFRIVGIFGSRSTLYARGKKRQTKDFCTREEEEGEEGRRGERREGGEGGEGGEGERGGGAKEEEEKPGHRVISIRSRHISVPIPVPVPVPILHLLCLCLYVLLRPYLYPAIPGFLDFRCNIMIDYPDVHIFLLDPNIIPIE